MLTGPFEFLGERRHVERVQILNEAPADLGGRDDVESARDRDR